MGQYTPEQRLQIIQIYYQNSRSLTATLRALRPFYRRHHLPATSTIQRLVQKFESTLSVHNVPVPVRQRNARSITIKTPPKRGNAKSKAENVVASEVAPDSTASEVPAKKRAGKALKTVEEKPVENKEEIKNNVGEEPAKNGSSKRGRKAKDIGNGEPKTENIESEVPSESSKSDEEQKETKVPAKRGRKPKDSVTDKPPVTKKTKAFEEVLLPGYHVFLNISDISEKL